MAFSLLLDAAKGVGHLHEELGVVHLDLKPENVLVFLDPNLHAKVADFGHVRGEPQRYSMKCFRPEPVRTCRAHQLEKFRAWCTAWVYCRALLCGVGVEVQGEAVLVQVRDRFDVMDGAEIEGRGAAACTGELQSFLVYSGSSSSTMYAIYVLGPAKECGALKPSWLLNACTALETPLSTLLNRELGADTIMLCEGIRDYLCWCRTVKTLACARRQCCSPLVEQLVVAPIPCMVERRAKSRLSVGRGLSSMRTCLSSSLTCVPYIL